MRIMRNKIVRNMLIFLSTLAMMTAVPFTATSVLGAGNLSGGGGGGVGNDSGSTSQIYCTKYKSNDCGYRLFLVPKDSHMRYNNVKKGIEGEVPFKSGTSDKFYPDEDWISFSFQMYIPFK